MKKYKVGIIGIGNIAYAHIDALRQLDNVEVTAICSRNNIEAKAKQLNIKHYYTDYKTMFDKEKLDSVHICTSNDVHFDIAKLALNKGVHVILEKPMTMDVKEALELVQVAKEKDLVAKVHFHNRFYAINQYIKEHIKDIGPIMSIHGEYSQGWATEQKVFNWRYQQKYGGNTRVIADIGTHYFDLVEYVTGHKIVAVSALLHQVYDKRAGHNIDTEDIGVVMYKTDKNAVGTALFTQSLAGVGNKLSFNIAGQTGSFISEGTDSTKVYFAKVNEDQKLITQTKINTLKNKQMYPASHFMEAFKEAFRQFYYEIEHRDFNSDYANFEDGLHSMKLLDAIYQSHITKQWVLVK